MKRVEFVSPVGTTDRQSNEDTDETTENDRGGADLPPRSVLSHMFPDTVVDPFEQHCVTRSYASETKETLFRAYLYRERWRPIALYLCITIGATISAVGFTIAVDIAHVTNGARRTRAQVGVSAVAFGGLMAMIAMLWAYALRANKAVLRDDGDDDLAQTSSARSARGGARRRQSATGREYRNRVRWRERRLKEGIAAISSRPSLSSRTVASTSTNSSSAPEPEENEQDGQMLHLHRQLLRALNHTDEHSGEAHMDDSLDNLHETNCSSLRSLRIRLDHWLTNTFPSWICPPLCARLNTNLYEVTVALGCLGVVALPIAMVMIKELCFGLPSADPCINGLHIDGLILGIYVMLRLAPVRFFLHVIYLIVTLGLFLGVRELPAAPDMELSAVAASAILILVPFPFSIWSHHLWEAGERVKFEALFRLVKRREETKRLLLFSKPLVESALPCNAAVRLAHGEVVRDVANNAAVALLRLDRLFSLSKFFAPSDLVRLLQRVFVAVDSVVAVHSVTSKFAKVVRVHSMGNEVLLVAGLQRELLAADVLTKVLVDVILVVSAVLSPEQQYFRTLIRRFVNVGMMREMAGDNNAMYHPSDSLYPYLDVLRESIVAAVSQGPLVGTTMGLMPSYVVGGPTLEDCRRTIETVSIPALQTFGRQTPYAIFMGTCVVSSAVEYTKSEDGIGHVMRRTYRNEVDEIPVVVAVTVTEAASSASSLGAGNSLPSAVGSSHTAAPPQRLIKEVRRCLSGGAPIEGMTSGMVSVSGLPQLSATADGQQLTSNPDDPESTTRSFLGQTGGGMSESDQYLSPIVVMVREAVLSTRTAITVTSTSPLITFATHSSTQRHPPPPCGHLTLLPEATFHSLNSGMHLQPHSGGGAVTPTGGGSLHGAPSSFMSFDNSHALHMASELPANAASGKSVFPLPSPSRMIPLSVSVSPQPTVGPPQQPLPLNVSAPHNPLRPPTQSLGHSSLSHKSESCTTGSTNGGPTSSAGLVPDFQSSNPNTTVTSQVGGSASPHVTDTQLVLVRQRYSLERDFFVFHHFADRDIETQFQVYIAENVATFPHAIRGFLLIAAVCIALVLVVIVLGLPSFTRYLAYAGLGIAMWTIMLLVGLNCCQNRAHAEGRDFAARYVQFGFTAAKVSWLLFVGCYVAYFLSSPRNSLLQNASLAPYILLVTCNSYQELRVPIVVSWLVDLVTLCCFVWYSNARIDSTPIFGGTVFGIVAVFVALTTGLLLEWVARRETFAITEEVRQLDETLRIECAKLERSLESMMPAGVVRSVVNQVRSRLGVLAPATGGAAAAAVGAGPPVMQPSGSIAESALLRALRFTYAGSVCAIPAQDSVPVLLLSFVNLPVHLRAHSSTSHSHATSHNSHRDSLLSVVPPWVQAAEGFFELHTLLQQWLQQIERKHPFFRTSLVKSNGDVTLITLAEDRNEQPQQVTCLAAVACHVLRSFQVAQQRSGLFPNFGLDGLICAGTMMGAVLGLSSLQFEYYGGQVLTALELLKEMRWVCHQVPGQPPLSRLHATKRVVEQLETMLTHPPVDIPTRWGTVKEYRCQVKGTQETAHQPQPPPTPTNHIPNNNNAPTTPQSQLHAQGADGPFFVAQQQATDTADRIEVASTGVGGASDPDSRPTQSPQQPVTPSSAGVRMTSAWHPNHPKREVGEPEEIFLKFRFRIGDRLTWTLRDGQKMHLSSLEA